MKIICYEDNNPYSTFQLGLYFPKIEWRNVYRPQIGDSYRKTEFDFSTKLCIIGSSKLYHLIVRILGFGFTVYVKDKT